MVPDFLEKSPGIFDCGGTDGDLKYLARSQGKHRGRAYIVLEDPDLRIHAQHSKLVDLDVNRFAAGVVTRAPRKSMLGGILVKVRHVMPWVPARSVRTPTSKYASAGMSTFLAIKFSSS
jgi:hypothetical protein